LSQYNLGMMYLLGQGVETSDLQAAQLFQRAADQNLPVAQRQLGSQYESGRGVAQDLVEAYRWYARAATGGNQDAARAMDALSPRLSADQIADARNRAGLPAAQPQAGQNPAK
jgi:TPR repeat protein